MQGILTGMAIANAAIWLPWLVSFFFWWCGAQNRPRTNELKSCLSARFWTQGMMRQRVGLEMGGWGPLVVTQAAPFPWKMGSWEMNARKGWQ